MNKTTFRSTLALSAVAIILAACGATAGTPDPSGSDAPSTPATPSVQPSVAPSEAPAESPDASPEPVGTLTAADGAVVDGPGVSLDEALAGDLSQPLLVRGALFLDADGNVFLADSVTDEDAPTFGDVRVAVANYPTDGPTWDMASADVTGLQEANGIRFFADTKLYGTISQ
ncbi:MAG TPA: hypothetical protein VHQ42_00465 [Candidatus Limnocylindria bacterium]|nr:hypothetical protein [Candidatus Limnocylindria bacterium]